MSGLAKRGAPRYNRLPTGDPIQPTDEDTIKRQPTHQKMRGGYYTPQPVASLLAAWAIQASTDRVLEPSCGDGALLAAAVGALRCRAASDDAIAQQLQGVEFDPIEAEKARARLAALGITAPERLIHTGDFFTFCRDHLLGQRLLGQSLTEDVLFDAVIGNPPFIRYQSFPDTHRTVAFEVMREMGLNPNRLTNAWVPFLVAATRLLRPGGRLAMVIPAELLQVHYAAEVRHFLSQHYRTINLVTFRALIFEDIQQEVVLILGERGDGAIAHEIRIFEQGGISDLPTLSSLDSAANGRKPLDASTEKWTLYFLDTDEITFLRELRAHPGLTVAHEVMDVNVGIVTGFNDFFLLTEPEAQRRQLLAECQRIVGRSAHLSGARFGECDWQRNEAAGLPSHLFFPPNQPLPALSEAARTYVAHGEALGIHRGYKCRIRPYWYRVPSFWVPDAFMLRQVHGYPKLVLNQSGATCTDTIHRVRFHSGTNGPQVVAAFVNSATLAFAEVTGRSYGGGVLTFEPSESRSLPIPLVNAAALELDEVDTLLRANQVEVLLDRSDSVLLREGLGLSARDCRRLRSIWHKLRDRRISRKHPPRS